MRYYAEARGGHRRGAWGWGVWGLQAMSEGEAPLLALRIGK
jgi:hypothetical protein